MLVLAGRNLPVKLELLEQDIEAQRCRATRSSKRIKLLLAQQQNNPYPNFLVLCTGMLINDFYHGE